MSDGGPPTAPEGAVEPADDGFIGSLEFYRQLAEPAGVLHVVIAPDLRVSWVSPSIRQIGGYEPEEIIGRSAIDLIHPDDLPQAMAAMNEAVTRDWDGESIVGRPYPMRLLAKHGHVWCEIGGDRFDDIDRGFIVRIRVSRTKELLDRFLEQTAAHARLEDALAPLLELFEYEVPDSRAMIGTGWDGASFVHAFVSAESTSAAVGIAIEPLTTTLLHAPDGRLPDGELEGERPGASTPWEVASVSGGLVGMEQHELPPDVAAAALEAGARACWAAPITSADGTTTACLVVWRAVAGPPWIGQDVFVDRTTRLASLALERHAHERRLVELAAEDPLTGLLNRRAFFEAIEQQGEADSAVLSSTSTASNR